MITDSARDMTEPTAKRRVATKRIASVAVSVTLPGAIFYFVVPDLPDFSTVWVTSRR